MKEGKSRKKLGFRNKDRFWLQHQGDHFPTQHITRQRFNTKQNCNAKFEIFLNQLNC